MTQGEADNIISYMKENFPVKSTLLSATIYTVQAEKLEGLDNETVNKLKTFLSLMGIQSKIYPVEKISLFGETPNEEEEYELRFAVCHRANSEEIDEEDVVSKIINSVSCPLKISKIGASFISENERRELGIFDQEITYICVSLDDLSSIQEIFRFYSALDIFDRLIIPPGQKFGYFMETIAVYDWRTDNKISRAIFRLLEENYVHFVYINDAKGEVKAYSYNRKKKANAGFRADLKRCFRSAWEANVARAFNLCGIEWEYEREIYDLTEDLSYLPDFFLKSDTIVEVKGFWNIKSRKKVQFFREKHPEIKLLLLDFDMYPTLNNMFKNVIPEWENGDKEEQKKQIIQIVGTKFYVSPERMKTIKIGDMVSLQREPENKYDKNAILATTKDGNPIGHVSADWSFIYSQKMDMGMTYTGTVKAIEKSKIDVEIVRDNLSESIVFDLFKK